MNRLHTTTRESVIRREIWFSKGDLIDTEELEELERNIRDLDLFAQIDVEFEIVPGDADETSSEADVLVSTREFNGEQSLLLNLESRTATAIQLLTMRLGAVVFVDAGWVGDRGPEGLFDEVHGSAGFGARLGSRELFGSGVFRLDLAFPFDDDSTRDYKPTLSLSIGQVFSFDS